MIDKIEELIDTPDLRNEWSDKALWRFKFSVWNEAIHQFNSMIDYAIDELPMLKADTDSYNKVVDFIHKKKSVTKKEILEYLGWEIPK